MRKLAKVTQIKNKRKTKEISKARECAFGEVMKQVLTDKNNEQIM